MLVDVLNDHKNNVSKIPKSNWNTGMGKFEADEVLLIESITLPMFAVKFTILPVFKNGEHAQKCVIVLKT